MPQVVNLVLFCPFPTRCSTVYAEICAFGKDEQPHRVKFLGTGQRAAMAGGQLFQPMLETFLVRRPLAREEDEAI